MPTLDEFKGGRFLENGVYLGDFTGDFAYEYLGLNKAYFFGLFLVEY